MSKSVKRKPYLMIEAVDKRGHERVRLLHPDGKMEYRVVDRLINGSEIYPPGMFVESCYWYSGMSYKQTLRAMRRYDEKNRLKSKIIAKFY